MKLTSKINTNVGYVVDPLLLDLSNDCYKYSNQHVYSTKLGLQKHMQSTTTFSIATSVSSTSGTVDKRPSRLTCCCCNKPWVIFTIIWRTLHFVITNISCLDRVLDNYPHLQHSLMMINNWQERANSEQPTSIST